MKGDTVRKRACNHCLDLLAQRSPGDVVPQDVVLSRTLGVSRTTVRAVLEKLSAAGVIDSQGGQRVIARAPVPADYFTEDQTETTAELVERRFMRWVLQGNCRPGQAVNASELARQFGTSTTAIREYLSHFRHFGLLERRPGSTWVFRGITEDFAEEIYEIREMFELRSARRFAALAPEHSAWAALVALEGEHRLLQRDIDARFTEFSSLDERFHRLVHDASRNRFITDTYDVLSMIFHYHYGWNKADERERNAVAITEHLRYIEALRARDARAIDAACRAHLRTAQETLLRSIRVGPFRV